MKNIIKEFKEFAIKGNVVDLAIAVVLGGAFGKIITSLVNDIIMPPIGLLVGGINFNELKIVLKDAVLDNAGKIQQEAVFINYGSFIQVSIDFLLIAASIFLFIRIINKIKDKISKEEKPAEVVPTNEEVLLKEIRDLLKNKFN